MGLLTVEQELTVRRNFEEYLDLYGKYYDSKALEYIKTHFLADDYTNHVTDIMHQVYSAIGLYDYIDNFYDQCIEEMAKTYNMDGNLLDVGCGFYPALAERIDRLQTNGSITAIDIEVFPISIGNVKIRRECFTRHTDIKGFSLVYGIMPCEATVPIIQNACENDVDFYINLCGCSHGVSYPVYPLLALNMWYSHIEDLVSDLLPENRKYEFYLPDWGVYPVIKSYKA